ncbi:MAG TPA: DUF1501 domain-containing protein [Planctomycetota bacterium]|nr:DUF1501 domain-containing protein [Planctomycetota bacterium]
MNVTRRNFLKSLAMLPAGYALLPQGLLRAIMAPPGAGPRNLVLVDLRGGNDGLNMVVPYGLAGGSYYGEFRQSLAVPLSAVLPLAGGIGLNPGLLALKAHFHAGRLAIAQGVSYPEPSFSHEVAQRIWQTGDPANAAPDGWLGRFLAQLGVPSSPSAVAVSGTLELLVTGSGGFVPNFQHLQDFSFPSDDEHAGDKANRRAAYAAITAGLAGSGGHLATMADTSTGILELIDLFATVPPFTSVGTYPAGSSLSSGLKLTMRLLHADIGMRYFHIPWGGFDTHADQELDGFHSKRMALLGDALHAFWQDLGSAGLADDTLVVVFSEFGRTVHENGSGGTDHGSVAPVLVFGNAAVGGLATPHPSMDPADLTESGELPMTTDLRDVFGTLVADWLGGDAAAIFPGHALTTLPLLV